MTTVADVVALLGAQLEPQPGARADTELLRPSPIADAGAGDVTFVSASLRPDSVPPDVTAALVIIDRGASESLPWQSWSVDAVIVSDHARRDFLRVISEFFTGSAPRGVHASAVVADGAQIDPEAYVGPLCSIGPEVTIGARSVLHAGVHLYGPVSIGRDVTIHGGTVIGADGFGYERLADGTITKFPHVGGVEIGDDVEIGANACIDRGTLGMTVIEAGAKVDNLVHVAHNVRIRSHAMVIADAMLGGSADIGERSWVAPSACISDGLTVGSDALVGLGAVVTRDVPQGETVAGNPARSVAELKELSRKLKALPDPAPQR